MSDPTDADHEPASIPLRLIGSADLAAALDQLPPTQAAWARANGFTGKLGQAMALPGPDGRVARVLIGWGDAAARRRERFHLGGFSRTAAPGTYHLETRLEQAQAEQAALGWLLGRYRFERYVSSSAAEGEDAQLSVPAGVDGGRLGLVAEGVFITRDLINTPANDMGPAQLEIAARRIADRHEGRLSVIKAEELIEGNFPLIHAVGRAGPQKPRLLDLRWGLDRDPAVTLVGKGVCFDTGGLNLKPASGMALMKKDMGGAATVLGLAHMIMGLGLRIKLRVLIPAVENSVSSSSFRPGDILRARNGLSVEINNTDAEGRLVLADALALAAEDEPELIIDLATLTGAARVALGPDLPPFFTDDEDLAMDLAESAEATADPLWRLPLWPAYEGDIEPGIADLDNAPSSGMAGAITAALFLKRFVGSIPWVHVDIYGWTPTARPGRPKGGESQGARALLHLLERRYGAQ